MERHFDIIVVGAGHAGCEAALAAARMGCRVLLTTLNKARVGFMSCNPAIGGIAKGQLVKEVDALGGEMALNADYAGIQFKRLNSSKGPAVRSSRAQCDKYIYADRMNGVIEKTAGIALEEREVLSVLVGGNRVTGVVTSTGEKIYARAVVLTTGTFLGGLMHFGSEQVPGGRLGDSASVGLTGSLSALGFRLQRLKTGTPPRLKRRSIDFSGLETQVGDDPPQPFSFYGSGVGFPRQPQIHCWLTYTNVRTHEVIAGNFDRSPMFSGVIKGVGPRYCPSIEDKVKRFWERDRHQIFLEPESLSSDEIYPNGLSTSLPGEVQLDFLRTISGLEHVEVSRLGYAVEYDCLDPSQLLRTLETKDVRGLFCGGQINGTSGYEEAAAQGLIAGINAASFSLDREPFHVERHEGYIGVLIDDLITKGTEEPYRMFTSRAEFRLLLREDNADLRLSQKGHELGLLSEDRYRLFSAKRESVETLQSRMRTTFINPTEENNLGLRGIGTAALKDRISLEQLLRRPEVNAASLERFGVSLAGFDSRVVEQVEIQAKYAGYIDREEVLIRATRQSEEVRIPLGLDFGTVGGLSREIVEKLQKVRPETLGQAQRIAGITPAAVANLLIHLRMGKQSDRLHPAKVALANA